MKLNILIIKETRAGEARVALIPKDIQQLINKGHKVFVENDAGKNAGFSNQEYENVGAVICYLENNNLEGYKKFFSGINIIVRAKRPARDREIMENKAIAPGTVMIGALDPLEKHSTHIDEYHQADIIAYSIDQLKVAADDPMNVLAAMSKIAGKLALLDAINKFSGFVQKVVIIGFGIVGQSALAEALNQRLATTVILTNPNHAEEIKAKGKEVVILNKEDALKQQQEIVKNTLLDADIVITSARRANHPAPILIPAETLQKMKKGTVIVDMAISEGGNVEDSEHDATHVLGNGIIVTNTSGYPKALPHEASQLWSKATLLFIEALLDGKELGLRPC